MLVAVISAVAFVVVIITFIVVGVLASSLVFMNFSIRKVKERVIIVKNWRLVLFVNNFYLCVLHEYYF